MGEEAFFDRIEINPRIMLGKPVIRGTRIPVNTVLNLMAEGQTTQEIAGDYPDLTPEDINAAVKFAARLTVFEEVPLQVELTHNV